MLHLEKRQRTQSYVIGLYKKAFSCNLNSYKHCPLPIRMRKNRPKRNWKKTLPLMSVKIQKSMTNLKGYN